MRPTRGYFPDDDLDTDDDDTSDDDYESDDLDLDDPVPVAPDSKPTFSLDPREIARAYRVPDRPRPEPRESREPREPGALRAPEPKLSPDPAVWLKSNAMTQTEVSLRLATYLITQRLITEDVSVSLPGYELTRRKTPRFPVVRYLIERGFKPVQVQEDWRASYRLKDARFNIRLSNDADVPDVMTMLTSGRRFIAYTSRGSLDSTRSPAEHRFLRAVIGQAITCETFEGNDVIAAVVPRSNRFRKLASRWRTATGVARAGLHILTVDRAGLVDGLPR
ncbi:MAG: hypothetical protein V4550_04115 [Gemmatimonadota bacterium]